MPAQMKKLEIQNLEAGNTGQAEGVGFMEQEDKS